MLIQNGGQDPLVFPKLFRAFELALFVGIALAFGFLGYMALKVRHFDYIKQHPIRFFLEFVAFSILPAIPLWLFMATRWLPPKKVWVWFGALWFKFALLHVLFEISGVYQFYFGNHRVG